ncbi:MAG: hypothetical protein ACRC5M_04860 [Anaeroplasmataceae bacterium]
MKISNLKTLETDLSYSITEDTVGIVVGDRDDTGSNTLKVYIPRFMQGIVTDGTAKDEPVTIKAERMLNSINKNIGSNELTLKNYLEIPPLSLPSVDPPRFTKGERIIVKFMDEDIKSSLYYPFQTFEVSKRQTDIVRMRTPSKANIDDPVVNENSYFLELNSRDKFVRLFTSAENGEKSPFTINLNTLDGIFSIKDDSENRTIEWNYDEDRISMKTDNGVVLEMKEAAVTLECETLDIKASESISMSTSKFKLEAEQGDFIIDNMYVKNSSYEQEAVDAKLKYDIGELSGSMWQIISAGLFLDAPATINTGMSIFAGFYVTKMPAPGKMPSVYAGGALDGNSPGTSSKPQSSQPDSSSPKTESTSSGSVTDMKGGGKGKPLAYAEPVIDALKAIAKQADKGVGLAKYHMHPGEYKPLAMNPASPSVQKPPAALEKTAEMNVNKSSNKIKATNFKA